ncbi:MAG: PDZ domain-containing protein, partial [Planctomycetes bacterium]|nr:PDZ domain-containing protein [Planctomycetota bacterium]
GDVIVSFNGRKIRTAKQLQSDLLGTEIGSEVYMCVVKGDYTITVYALPIERPSYLPPVNKALPWLGAKVSEVLFGTEEAKKLEEVGKAGGILIEEVIRNSPAEEAGLQADDIIMSFNSRKTRTLREFLSDLAGDGGHYDSFGSSHDVNYHLRSIAHNTILVHDPSETWPNIRAGTVSGNDGGQSHSWPHHNGAVTDPQQWLKGRRLYDIADILAFEDRGEYLYVAGDCTRAYSPDKLEYFTRQIVFLRPGIFVIFDRVCSTNPQFKKTWLLQAMKEPADTSQDMVVTNGKGRLFIQTLLPENPQIKLVTGADSYSYDGNKYPPGRDTGPSPQCRIEISPPEPATVDYFLHVLTATDTATTSVEKAALNVTDQSVMVMVGPAEITFTKSEVGGNIIMSGHTDKFVDRIIAKHK